MQSKKPKFKQRHQKKSSPPEFRPRDPVRGHTEGPKTDPRPSNYPGHTKQPKAATSSEASKFSFIDRSGKVHERSSKLVKSHETEKPRFASHRSSHKNESPSRELAPKSFVIKKSVGHTTPSHRPSRDNKDSKNSGRPERPERSSRPERSGKFRDSKSSSYPSSYSSSHSPRGQKRSSNDRDNHRGGGREADKSGLTKVKARVDKNARGFGFLVIEDSKQEDIFLPPPDAAQFFQGDRVEALIDKKGGVYSIKLLEHRFKELTGRFEPAVRKSGTGFLVYEKKRTREEIFIPSVPASVQAGDWIQAKLSFHEKGQYAVTGEITEIYGPILPASSDIKILSSELGLKEEHSPEAVAEAKGFGANVDLTQLKNREDLRGVPFITIDGETARDFDDAIYVERQKSGFVLWVAIADVSHYVQEGTQLNLEARERSTSVYFPERAFHMLPGALSENLCSLKPNVPRFTLVAKMTFDHQGIRKDTELMEAVIESKRRATYNQIEDEWKVQAANKSWEYAPHFELYQLIRKQRSSRGSIDFDLPEAEIKCKPTGEVESIKIRARLDSHRLIEEFMVAANEAVTNWMQERDWSFVYRVHDIPSRQALEKFQKLALSVGFPFEIDEADSPLALAELVRRFQGHSSETLLNIALLRSLKQAVYSSVHGIHYGLASPGYTHFTSPIRRYPDLVVHRLLRWAMNVERGELKKPEGKAHDELEQDLAQICDHSSYRERLASEAERESTKLKQTRLMAEKLGEEFDGKINGMIESGFFVKISDPYVEGMVSRENLGDDFYQFNEEKMIFYARRSRHQFKMGDEIKVRVLKADIEKRQIDFGLVIEERTGKRADARGDSEDSYDDEGEGGIKGFVIKPLLTPARRGRTPGHRENTREHAGKFFKGAKSRDKKNKKPARDKARKKKRK